MCVGVVAWRAHPRWPLLVAANRDEFHARPTAPLARWSGNQGLLAGRDLTAGGTWLGVSDTGRFAFVTNHRVDGPAPQRGSRGSLVTDWLSGTRPDQIDTLNPFNFIMIDQIDGATFLGNVPAPVERRLDAGIHGLSNGPVDEPWPKTERLDAAVRSFLAQASGDPSALFGALRDESLPDGAPADGPAFPAIFVRNPHYGTRSSTVVAVDAAGVGWIEERRFDSEGLESGRTRIPFDWPL
jgi:uncharacterized protein with NRDE domain